MDLTPYMPWIVFIHVAGAFAFAAGHGVSMFVAFRVRTEPDRARLATLLDLSGTSLGVAGIGMRTRRSARAASSGGRPQASLPNSHATGPRSRSGSACRTNSAPSSAPAA